MLMMAIGTVFMVCVVNPWLTFVSIPVLVAFVLVRQYTIGAIRGLRRLEATREYTHFFMIETMSYRHIPSCMGNMAMKCLSNAKIICFGLSGI